MFNNEKAFTLIEMLIVLLVITVLIILFIPNLTDQSSAVHDKGCEALVQTVQSQVYAYQLDHGKLPSSLQVLVNEQYISNDQLACQNNKSLKMSEEGVVSVD